MAIVDYELFHVPPRWLFLRVETDDGLVGWGEPIVEGRAKTVETAVEELMEGYLLGEDPNEIERHWQTMYRGGFYRGGPVLMSAIAGVDQALWDLKGKRHGLPVYELLGGAARDRVEVYRGVGGGSPAAIAADAKSKVDTGYRTLKMGAVHDPLRRVDTPAVVDDIAGRLAAARNAVDDDVNIGVDVHGRVAKSMAKRLIDALEEYDPMFIEEPVLAEQNDALANIVSATSVPIATGERMFSRWDFKPVFEDQTVDIIQPDISHAGGITEVHKIAAMAEAYDVALAPHCPLGPIAFASCLQVDMCAPNALVQEQSIGVHDPDNELMAPLAHPDVFGFDDGFVEAPEAPGLGIELDEEWIRSADHDGDWRNPVWRHEDGSVAEW